MYVIVASSLSQIQKGVQGAHAVVELMHRHPDDKTIDNWAKHHKTLIMLDGGTTNKIPKHLGSLNKTLENLKTNFPEVKLGYFYEPDLGDQLTAICFVCSEDQTELREFTSKFSLAK